MSLCLEITSKHIPVIGVAVHLPPLAYGYQAHAKEGRGNEGTKLFPPPSRLHPVAPIEKCRRTDETTLCRRC